MNPKHYGYQPPLPSELVREIPDYLQRNGNVGGNLKDSF